MADYGHEWTDKRLDAMERKIRKLYGDTLEEAKERLKGILDTFSDDDKKYAEMVEAGKMKKRAYKAWREETLGKAKHLQDMIDILATDFTNADKIAMKIVGEEALDVYATNANYAAFAIEKNMNVNLSWTLYDRSTVERLIRDDPDILPLPSVDIPLDMRWNRQHINSAITKGILLGDPIPEIAQRLVTVANMGMNAAIRNARTATTAAECAGRQDTYQRAKGMGIQLKKQWLATLDGKTRHAHRMLDGQTVDVEESFQVDGYKLKWPGDPSAPGYLIYNCRCTMISVDKFHDQNAPRASKLGEVSYEEWKNGHEINENEKWSITKPKEQTIEDITIEAKKNVWNRWDEYRKKYVGHGVDFSKYDVEKLPDSVSLANIKVPEADRIVKKIDDLGSKFYSPLTNISTMSKAEAQLSNAFAVTTHHWGLGNAELKLNPAKVSENGISRIFELSQKGYSVRIPKGKELDYLISHEYGHLILNAGEKLPGKTQNFAQVDFANVKSARKEISKIWDRYCTDIKQLKSNYDSIREPIEEKMLFGIGNIDITDAERKALATAKEAYMKAKISDYSLVSADEFIAECFADVEVGSSPNEYAKEVYSIIKKYFGK